MKPVPQKIFIAGLLLFLTGAGIGFVLTVVSVLGAFQSLAQNGIADPKTLAVHIGTALTVTVLGLVVGGFGVVTMVVAAIVYFVNRKSSKPTLC